MGKLVYAVEEQKAHELIAALEGQRHGAVLAPSMPGDDRRHVVITVDEEEVGAVESLVSSVAPSAEKRHEP